MQYLPFKTQILDSKIAKNESSCFFSVGICVFFKTQCTFSTISIFFTRVLWRDRRRLSSFLRIFSCRTTFLLIIIAHRVLYHPEPDKCKRELNYHFFYSFSQFLSPFCPKNKGYMYVHVSCCTLVEDCCTMVYWRQQLIHLWKKCRKTASA